MTLDPSGAARAPQPVTELLAEVKAALQRATPGPWSVFLESHSPYGFPVHGPFGASCYDEAPHVGNIFRAPDAELIAKAPAWLGALVRAVEDGQAEVSRLRADGQRLRDELRPVLEMLDAKTENEHLIPSAVQRVRGILRSALGGDAS